MTPEEAAELILRGDPWWKCIICHGTGKLDYKQNKVELLKFVLEQHEEKRLQLTNNYRDGVCWSCNGNPYWLDKDYEQACKMLDKVIPPLVRYTDVDPIVPGATFSDVLRQTRAVKVHES